MEVGGQRYTPAALPPGKTRYPSQRRLSGSQGQSGRVRKNSPPSVFDPWTAHPVESRYNNCAIPAIYTGWRTKCHTIDCARNTFLLLQKHLTSGTELILIGWKIVPNEEHVQCYLRFASQPLANEPLHSSQLFDTSLQKARSTTSLCGP